ncbi:unnamed protein product [Meganyctiphanes norvegica]|uniref:Sodium-coupled monocarboxylate transporter 1 n=1 Tax=Meganyctiphanes norvegica TaxID=48144 RepID=A0AAV2RCC1_MEGNR
MQSQMESQGAAEAVSFGLWDYLVFSFMLFGSLAIGTYQAFKGVKNADDYLLGGRKMKIFPVAVSLFSSFMSSIGILGFSGETYGHGIESYTQMLGAALGISLVACALVPVLHPLHLTSINQYIGLRFGSRSLQRLTMILGVVQGLLYMGICLYAPTVALTSLTPISSTVYIIVLGIITTVYSTVASLRAVVWVDVFQIGVMVAGVLTVITVACAEVGGLGEAWEIADQYNRTSFFNFRVDFYERHNFLNLMLMGSFYWGSMFGVTQANFQRLSSVPTLRSALSVILMTICFLVGFSFLLFLSGAVVFAVYAECSPLSLGYIKTKDQILSYFVLDKLSFITGVPGLFVAAVFSGALSSISSSLTGIVAMLWKDIFQLLPRFEQISHGREMTINKFLSVLVGIVMMILAYLSSKLGGLVQAATTVNGVTAGPMLGLFLMASLVPWVNRAGAWAGITISWSLNAWLSLGGLFYGSKPDLLPLSTEGCLFPEIENLNQTITEFLPVSSSVTSKGWVEENIYGLSYCVLQVIGAGLCVIIGCVVSLLTGGENLHALQKDLVHPVVRRFLPEDPSSNVQLTPSEEKPQYESTESLQNIVAVNTDLSKL